MPHLILEHSKSLADKYDLAQVSQDLFDAALASGQFADGKAIKSRTIASDNAVSGAANNEFAHLTLRLITGRSVETRKKLAEECLAVLEKHFAEVGSLSVQPLEIDPDTYAKRVL